MIMIFILCLMNLKKTPLYSTASEFMKITSVGRRTKIAHRWKLYLTTAFLSRKSIYCVSQTFLLDRSTK